MRRLRALVVASILALVGCGGSAERWTAEGDRLLRDNSLVEAEKAYNRAIARDPHYAPALYGKGWALFLSGHDDLLPAARQLFQRAIDYDPDYWGGHRGMGVLLLREGKSAPAEKQLRAAFDRDPEEPTVLLSLGELYLRAGRPDDAEKLFDAAISLAPERGEFLSLLAEVELERADFDAAMRWIEEGRGRPVSGRRGLVLLDEGEIRVHLARATHLLRTAYGPADPQLDEALTALSAADSLLEKVIREDPRGAPPALRRKYHQRLRTRVEEAQRE